VLEDVVVLLAGVERERILEAGAAAALDGDPQHLLGLVRGDEVANLLRGRVGDRHC